MARFGFHPFRAWRALISADAPAVPPPEPPPPPDGELKALYVAHVEALKAALPHDEAMEQAIGGGFDLIGGIEAGLVRCYSPPDGYVIDVGCGSGRLAKPLSGDPARRYLGVDLVPDLVAHARAICGRPDWRFEVIDHIAIPEADGQADLVCFFSVLTHLTHEQGYWYLEEARRVLKPGGRVLFSFLEFQEPDHWKNFRGALEAAKAGARQPPNVFHDRGFFPSWAEALGMELEAVYGGRDVVVPEGNLGQAFCVLRRRA
jgi:SAM-dependent methyltransferase